MPTAGEKRRLEAKALHVTDHFDMVLLASSSPQVEYLCHNLLAHGVIVTRWQQRTQKVRGMSEPDAQLLGNWRHGEAGAFTQLFLRHYQQVYRVVYGLVANREEAEDLAQETFLALYRQPPTHLDGDASLVSWLCRVALNRGYNALRSERRSRERIERVGRLELPAVLNPEMDLIRAEEQAIIRAVLQTLPERQSRLLLLRYAGLSYAEIASVIAVAPNSIGTLLARAEKAFLAAYAQANPIEQVVTEK